MNTKNTLTPMKRGTASVALMILLTAFLSACGGAPQVRDIEDPKKGLVFGELDMNESDIAVTHVIVKRVDKVMVYRGKGGEGSTHTFVSGGFFAENLEPGKYIVAGFFSGNTVYYFEEPQPFSLAPGAIRYAGSYKIRYQKTGLFKFDKSSVERRDSATNEARLLDWLFYRVEGTNWQPKVHTRMKK